MVTGTQESEVLTLGNGGRRQNGVTCKEEGRDSKEGGKRDGQ